MKEPRQLRLVIIEGPPYGGPNVGRATTDTTKPNGDRDRFSVREVALDRNYRPHRWDHLEAAHKKSGKTPEGG